MSTKEMSLENRYNLKSPGVKRLMREACELAEPTEEYFARPLEDNLFEWHFTVRGPSNTEFEGGFYHGRILLPSQYPMQPPNIILLTPNGRFEVNKKICLSISGHHPESWQPSWSIRTALLALIAFMPTPAAATIGSLDYTKEERQVLARKSKNWECPVCGKIVDHLNVNTTVAPQLTQEESSLIQQIALKGEDENKKDHNVPKETTVEDEQEVDDIDLEEMTETTTISHQVEATSTGASIVLESQVSINQHTIDKVFIAVAWSIVAVIVMLIARRLFLLE